MKRFRYFLIFFTFLLFPAFSARALSSSELRAGALSSEIGASPDALLSESELSRLLSGTADADGLTLTRGEFASALYRYVTDNDLELPVRCGYELRDAEDCGFHADAVRYLLRGGVMGTDASGFFRPQETVKCGEASLAVTRLKLFCRPRRSGQPASSLPVTSPESGSVFSSCLMLGHSNVVGLDMLVHTDLDIIAKVGASSFDFLSAGDLSFGWYGSGFAVDGLHRRQYSVVYIMLGTNDMAQGLNVLDGFRQHMSEIIELTAGCQPDARLCLLAITPVGLDVPLYSEEILQFNRALKELSRACGTDYLDIYTPLSDRNGANRPGLARNDGLHYGEAGYMTILNTLLTHFPEVYHEP